MSGLDLLAKLKADDQLAFPGKTKFTTTDVSARCSCAAGYGAPNGRRFCWQTVPTRGSVPVRK
jgi:hypothetical protein